MADALAEKSPAFPLAQTERSNFWLGTLQSTLVRALRVVHLHIYALKSDHLQVRLQKGEEFLRQSDVAMGFLANASSPAIKEHPQ